jgi:hypothetical protein
MSKCTTSASTIVQLYKVHKYNCINVQLLLVLLDKFTTYNRTNVQHLHVYYLHAQLYKCAKMYIDLNYHSKDLHFYR